MQRFRDMPINRKLSLVILLTCTAVLLLAGAAMIGAELVTSRRAMVQQITILADLLARNSTAPLAFHREEDLDEVNQTLSALSADLQILGVRVFDEDNQAFGQYLRDGYVGDLPARPGRDGHSFSGGFLQVTRPIMMDAKRIGTIYVRASLGKMYAQLLLHAAIVVAILLLIFVTTFALAPRLRQPIAEPILALAQVARRVASTRDYSARADKRSEDEVGLLTDAFNQMLGKIETTQSSLQQANSDLAIAKDAAEAANRAKDQFLAVLSHELRTPLTPVLLTLSLLEERDQLPEDVQADLQAIRRHVELEARLIDDLLDLTRIARGKMQLSLETIDAHLLVQDALKICCSERLSDMTLSLNARYHHVKADSGRLLQVFWNLLNNAAKFTPSGKPIVISSSNPSRDRVRIEVIDKGIGIDPSALPRIFNAFEQGDAGFGRQSAGLGLGLAIAKALTEAHGGSLSAHSAGKGQGAVFAVELATVAAEPAETARRAPITPSDGHRGPLRILLVEDHEGTLYLMTKLLQHLGHDVEGADSVKSALAIAERGQIDLVISDLGLPDGSGHDLMRQLRQQHGLRGICLSGFGMEEDIARSAEAGFSHHLIKPVDLRTLQTVIQSIHH